MIKGIKNLNGTSITTDTGKRYKLGNLIGSGAQGIIYETDCSDRLIKLYYPSEANELDDAILERLQFIKSLTIPKNYVHVLDIIRTPCIGYVMERVLDYKSLNTYLIPEKDSSFPEWYNRGLGLRERIFIGYMIAKAFSDLERQNLSYCDISGNNILVQIKGGIASVKMIDVDNIYVAGKGNAAILGTPRYIAPEVINHQRTPDVLSDNYSLAVILFELLRVGHPYISDEILDGSPEEEEVALSGKGEYVTDENSTNMLPADIVLTEKLRELFRRCFVDGKIERLRRPSAKEFEYALLEASNKLIKCPHCGAWHYPRKSGRIYEGCPWCDGASRPKARLNFYDVLTEGGNYRTCQPIDGSKHGTLVNSFILREGKNQIKGLYILRFDDTNTDGLFTENYLTIAKDSRGYWAYNEFNKSGIIIREYATGRFLPPLQKNHPVLLKNGDAIYFEVCDTGAAIVNVGRHVCSFIRKAVFMEENQ